MLHFAKDDMSRYEHNICIGINLFSFRTIVDLIVNKIIRLIIDYLDLIIMLKADTRLINCFRLILLNQAPVCLIVFRDTNYKLLSRNLC